MKFFVFLSAHEYDVTLLGFLRFYQPCRDFCACTVVFTVKTPACVCWF